jgi:hypothetical protein
VYEWCVGRTCLMVVIVTATTSMEQHTAAMTIVRAAMRII